MRYKVVGPLPIAGKDGDVEPGGVVELDEQAVNIPALIAAGHVKPVAAERPKDKA